MTERDTNSDGAFSLGLVQNPEEFEKFKKLERQESKTPEVLVQSFDSLTGKCTLEGIKGRAKTCPNNPNWNSNHYSREICVGCVTHPHIAASSNKPLLPTVYAPLRQQRYMKKTE